MMEWSAFTVSQFQYSYQYSGRESRSVVSSSLGPHGLYSPWNSPGQNTGVGSLSLLQGIFLTQGSDPGLLHCRWILYQLSHKGSPRILEWVPYPFSRGSSHPRNRTGLSCVEADHLPTELSGSWTQVTALICWQSHRWPEKLLRTSDGKDRG